MQSYRGSGGRVACHSLPCQLVLNNQFPHQLRAPGGQPLGRASQERLIRLSARCTWQPLSVNGVDSVLEWAPEADFVGLYCGAARDVLAGNDAEDVYRAFTARKAALERDLLEIAEEQPLGERDLSVVAQVLADAAGGDHMAVRQEVEQLLTDREALEGFQRQQVTILERYVEADLSPPRPVVTGELRQQVQSEN
jgi:hypothetical protein